MAEQDHFANIVRSSEDAILSKDLNGIVTSWNPAAERLFGYSADEIIGTAIIRLFPADLVHQEDMILARIRAEEPVGMIHTRRLHKDGRVLDVALTISPLRDASGKVIGASKIVRDARPWLESERRRLESETNFETVANSIPQLCWICDPAGKILWYNRRWTEYTGYTLDQLHDDAAGSVHHPDYKDQTGVKFREHLASGEEWEDTFPLRGKDGQYRWFLSRAEPIRDEAGNIARWFGTDTDITEMREASERIRLLMLEVNHRSKNMLGVVMALGRNTLRLSGGDFLERFNQRLLSLAANQDVLVQRNWTEVPVAELVEAQMKFIQGTPGTMETSGPHVSLTPKAAEVIGMALHELATNAIKHGALSQEGGEVSLIWEAGPATDGLLLRWIESGGPPVAEPSRTGFGTTLIRDIPARSLGPTVLDYRAEGLFWELRCGPEAIAGGDLLAGGGG